MISGGVQKSAQSMFCAGNTGWKEVYEGRAAGLHAPAYFKGAACGTQTVGNKKSIAEYDININTWSVYSYHIPTILLGFPNLVFRF